MSTIVTRAGKGSALTHTEVDTNFTNLNTDKVETAAIVQKYKTADVTITSNDTRTDDADLKTFTLAAGSYIIEGQISVIAETVDPDISIAFQLVSGTISDSSITTGVTGGATPVNSGLTVTDYATARNMALPAGATQLISIYGFITVSSAAVIDFQWAQNNVSADDLTVKKGSFIRFTKV